MQFKMAAHTVLIFLLGESRRRSKKPKVSKLLITYRGLTLAVNTTNVDLGPVYMDAGDLR